MTGWWWLALSLQSIAVVVWGSLILHTVGRYEAETAERVRQLQDRLDASWRPMGKDDA